MVQRKNAVEKSRRPLFDYRAAYAGAQLVLQSERSIAREGIFLNDANTDCRLRSEIALPSLDLARES
jgi:hypothetical protein